MVSDCGRKSEIGMNEAKELCNTGRKSEIGMNQAKEYAQS